MTKLSLPKCKAYFMEIFNFLKNKPHQNPQPDQKEPQSASPVSKANDEYHCGDRIGGEFLVKEVFGGASKSGMGVVYLVEDRKHSTPFIMKTFQQTKKMNDLGERFRKEAEAWVRIGLHPNIVQALWVEEIDFNLFVAAEYISKDEEGRNNLRDFISQGVLNPYWALAWSAQFCYGMKHSISKGLNTHRDIKPENLMIDSDLNLKITDFGLASIADSLSTDKTSGFKQNVASNIQQTKSTKPGSILGTLPYLAPEQIARRSNIDHRADIYAFGVILYEMLTGGDYPYNVSPNSKDIQNEFLGAHLNSKPKMINTPLWSLIDRCLQKEPNSRYQNFDEFLQDIKNIAATMKFSLPLERKVPDTETEELYVKAQSLSVLGRDDEALALIEKYIALMPDDFAGWNQKARILMNKAGLNNILADEEAEREKNSAPFYRECLNGAEKALSESLRLNPLNSHAWNNLGLCLKRQKKYEQSIGAFLHALEMDTQNSGAMMNLGLAYFESGKYQESANIYLKTLKQFPKKETLCFNAGNTASLISKKGHVQEAMIIFEELTRIKPQGVNYWHNLALSHWHFKRYSEAINCFKKVSELTPEDEFAWVSLAKLNSEMGQYENAIECCDQAIVLKEGFVKGVSIKAQLLAQLGKFKEAILCLKNGIGKRPNEDTFYFILANLSEQKGLKQESLNAALKCKELLTVRSNETNGENLSMVNEIIRRNMPEGK